MSEPPTDPSSLWEAFWLSGALTRLEQLAPEPRALVRRSALAAAQALQALAALEPEPALSEPASVLRRSAVEHALCAYLAGQSAPAPAGLSELVAAARSAGLSASIADSLVSAAGEPVAGSERALARLLAGLPWRTRDELLWQRVVRCVAVPSLIFGAAFTAAVVRQRMPVPTEQAAPAPHAAPARPQRVPGAAP